MPPAIDPTARADMHAQLDDTPARSIPVTQIASLDVAQPNSNAGLRHLVAKTNKPFGEWFTPVIRLISEQSHHMPNVA